MDRRAHQTYLHADNVIPFTQMDRNSLCVHDVACMSTTALSGWIGYVYRPCCLECLTFHAHSCSASCLACGADYRFSHLLSLFTYLPPSSYACVCTCVSGARRTCDIPFSMPSKLVLTTTDARLLHVILCRRRAAPRV